MKEIIKRISNIKNDLNNSKTYVKTSKIPLIKSFEKNPIFYDTTCLICNKACHSSCEIADDDEKKMYFNGPKWLLYDLTKKCKWDQHKNRNYILKEFLEEKEIILEDLKNGILIVKMNYLLRKNYFL